MPPHEINASQTVARTDERINVLHVDDDESLVELSAEFLERQSDLLSVHTELSPSDALEYLAEHDVDCVVSDYDMPGKNGLEFLEAVREQYPNLPFILFTGKGSEQIASEAISKGVTDYLQKQTGTEQYELLANRICNTVDQHRASQRAQQIERWLRELAEKTNNVLWIFSEDMDDVIFANSTFEDIFGIPTERLRENPLSFLEAIHPEDRPQAKETVERLLDGQPAEIEHRVNECEDYQRWVYVRGQPILNADGEVVRIVGITTEITERKEREQQLRLFRRAVESSGHSIYFTNQNGVIEYVNEAFTETTGYTAEEAIGRTPQILQSGEHDQEFYEELWTTILDGGVWRNEVINERKDGERNVIDQTIAPVTDETGEIAHFVAVNVDITEQKRTEQRLEAFIDSASDILSIVDDKGIVQEVSPAAKDIIGYAPEEIVGESVFEYIHPEDRQHVEEKFSDLVASTGDDTIRVQYRFDHADGSWHWLESVGNNCMDTTLEGCVITTRDISERKERIQELEQASARLEALFERSPDMINVHDSDGTILDVNQRFCDVINATEDELIGKQVWEIDEAHDSDEFHRKIQQIDVGERLRTETKYQCQDGASIPIEVHVVRTAMGDDERFIVISRDITEQKTYEDQLRKERQFVQSIFDALPDPLYAFDTEGRLIRWNDQFEEITGHRSDEIEGKHFTEFVPEKEIETITQSFQTILEEGQSVTVESLVETNDGDPIPFELTGGPLADSTDGLQGITGVGRDITERKKHEQQLTTLNETAQDVMSVDTRQQVAEIGIHAARDVLGLDANAVHLYDDDQNGLVPTAQTDEGNALVGDPPILKEGDSIAWRVYTSGETLAHDNVQNDPDIHNPETSVQSELYLPLGEHGVFIVASEESEAFDEQDRILGEILAGTLTAAFDQVEHAEQLRAREQELARQNERLEEFVNVVSHDLRNPLNVAEARVELAQDECDSEHLEPVSQAHNRMEALIDDLLTLAREGNQVSDPQSVDLAVIAKDCWETVETDDGTIQVEIDETVCADSGRLKQLFENLYRNAIEHSSNDVTITVGSIDDGFYIEDDGPGIAEDDREDVFDAGYSTEEDGTGLGLSIVKRVAEAHGWEVCLTESSEGGARFEITGVEIQ